MGKLTFTKTERLSREKLIKELFAKGSSFNLYPFRVLYQPQPLSEPASHQVLISVSIRNFKKAVDRNLLKRRIREAWRIHKDELKTESKLSIAYIYTSRTTEPFSIIKLGVEQAIAQILAGKHQVKRTKKG